MGGVSQSRFYQENGAGVLEGEVSLKNNGGFASVRKRFTKPIDLSDCDGIRLRILGDGKNYAFRLKMLINGEITRYSYEAGFQTTEAEETELYLPFSEFEPYFRGRYVGAAAPLDPEKIIETAFMIKEKQEGYFRLKIIGVDGV